MKNLQESKKKKNTKELPDFILKRMKGKKANNDAPVEESKKKLSPAQKKIAQTAPPSDEITGADFKALAKKKKKMGKMRVACTECNSDIIQIKESRTEFRIKLRGYCESCCKQKVVYVDDMVQIENSGKRFDRIIETALPSTALPLPQSTNPKSQVPANPASTTAAVAPGTTPTTPPPAAAQPPAATPPVDPVAMAAKIVQQAAALLKDPAKLIDHMQKSADELKKAQDLHAKQTPPVAPAATGTTPAAPGTPPATQPVK